MLKTKVGYSVEKDSFTSGEATARMATEGMEPKVGLLFTSVLQDQSAIMNGVKSIVNAPVVGCTSSGGIIVPDGVISSEDGFSGMMAFDDPDLTVGVACHEAGEDARKIGRKVAIEAVKNAGSNKVPSYFYMVASPKEEEAYLKGIQDVIGRVPFFGGSAADDTVEGKWSIFCNDQVFSDGVAVVFFYTNKKYVTEYTGAYRETEHVGIVTEVQDDRKLVSIDGVGALKKYAEWAETTPDKLQGGDLLAASICKPLGVKDPLGSLTVIRHPMFGDDMGTKDAYDDDTINLGNKVVKNTAIMQLEATVDELINSTGDTLNVVNDNMGRKIAGYFLVHCGGRKLGIGDRIHEVHEQLVQAANGVPFITIFTFGEYGYHDHSGNICGGLMLSFTGMSEE